MSGPVMLPTSRTRADWALYGPSSGKPSTIASSPVSASLGGERHRPAPRSPGT